MQSSDNVPRPLVANPTEDDLRRWACEHAVEFPDMDLQTRAWALAHVVVINMLGREWYKQRVHSGGPGDAFLRTMREHWDDTEETRRDRLKHQDRVTALGEMLFNLQHVRGFPARLLQLLEQPTVEATAAELEGGKYLRGRVLEFRL